MDRSIFRIKRTKTLHQDWKHKKSAELEKQRRDFLEEKRKLEEDRRNFEREKREFSTHCQLEKDSMKREKQLFETKWKILEEELSQLADEKIQMKKQRDFYKYVREQEARDMLTVGTENVVRGDLFANCHVYSEYLWLNLLIMLLGIVLFAAGTGLYASASLGRVGRVPQD